MNRFTLLKCIAVLSINIVTVLVMLSSLEASPIQQDNTATLRLENNSQQTVRICDVFAVRTSPSFIFDQQDPIEITANNAVTLSLPAGKYNLLISDCEQTNSIQQTNVSVTGTYTMQVGTPVAEKAELRVINNSNQTICTAYVANFANQTVEKDIIVELSPLHQNEFQIVQLPSANYNIVVADCEMNPLLIEYSVAIQQSNSITVTTQSSPILSAGECRWLGNRGMLAFDTAYYDQAMALYEMSAKCHAANGDHVQEAVMLSAMGNVDDALGRYEDALEKNQLALEVLGEEEAESTTALIQQNIGAIYYRLGLFPEALDALEAALVIREKTQNKVDLSTTLLNIGVVYGTQGLYNKALENYQRALSIVEPLRVLRQENVIRQSIGEAYRSQGKYSQAEETFKNALQVSRDLKDRLGESVILNNLALVYQAKGDNAKAKATFEKSLAVAREIGNKEIEIKSLSGLGAIALTLGEQIDAEEKFEQALNLAQEIDALASVCRILISVGTAYRTRGLYEQEVDAYNQALPIAKRLNLRAEEGVIYNNLAAAFYLQGNYVDAKEHYELALEIAQEIGDRKNEGARFANLGKVYRSQGRFQEALDLYQRAQSIMEQIGDRVGESTVLNNIGELFAAQGRYEEAIVHFQSALSVAQETGIQSDELVALNGMLIVYLSQGNIQGAQEVTSSIPDILNQIENPFYIARTFNNIGGIFQVNGLHDESLQYFNEALTIQQQIGDKAGEGDTFNNIGASYYYQGDYEQAIYYFEQSLKIQEDIGNVEDQSRTLISLGMSLEVKGNYNQAGEYYSKAMNLAEQVRSLAGIDTARSAFIDKYAELYSRAVGLFYHLGDTSTAFQTTERGRARTFLDTMATGQVEISDDTVNELIRREIETRTELELVQDALIQARASTSPDLGLIAELERQLSAAETIYAQTLNAIEARQDQLLDLIPGRNHILSVEAVQQQLDDQTTLISYWTLQETTIAFLITVDDFDVVELSGATKENLDTAVTHLHQWLNISEPYPRSLRDLYQWLVTPLASYLQTPQVVIVPHQSLHYVPFAALTNGETYFGQQYILSVLPSASVLPFLEQNAANTKRTPNPTSLVFGNPQTSLSTLPASEVEATTVADLLNTTVYTGTAASEVQLRTAVSGTTILHLAAHGAYNQANALYSAIYLAPSASVTATQSLTPTAGLPTIDTTLDGRLETHEIFGLPLAGNGLVVLSACETNVGELSRGDELVGLTRAFFFAGTPTVISSLWNVDDAATETLMVSFYRHWLEKGMSKAAALQAAQADVRANPRWASPFYWAGFVLNGHPGFNETKP